MQERPLGLMIWWRMVRFVQRSNCISNAHLERSGISVAQFEALSHIRAYQPVTQTDLAAGLTISVGGVSRMLSRLETEGLIERVQDWKVKYISLTPAGEKLLSAIYPGQVALQASMFDDVLDADEQKQLYALMRKVQLNSLAKEAPAVDSTGPLDTTETAEPPAVGPAGALDTTDTKEEAQ
ncbi:MarR family transcriptional regulator [Kocuria indica]|uniref:MarR family transcriptional regulator n=1 Tax=Kocuria marina subsp. indica TaxID=1049583 RepID=A0A6N9QWE0_9MICC|nr:MarR family transcriptional regulator [Kocuria indica]